MCGRVVRARAPFVLEDASQERPSHVQHVLAELKSAADVAAVPAVAQPVLVVVDLVAMAPFRSGRGAGGLAWPTWAWSDVQTASI